jgi:uncharacterized membrane protein
MRRFLLALHSSSVTLTLRSVGSASAAATVRAVLFYSPRCGHCHIVISEHLPPLQQRYGDQLQILMIDVDQAQGAALYRQAIVVYAIPEARRGVPTMIIGDTALVGSVEIPRRLPGLIETLLAARRQRLAPDPRSGRPACRCADECPGGRLLPPATAETLPFLRDLPANALAVVVLIGMLLTVMWAGITWSRPGKPLTRHRDRSIPLLAIGGVVVAGYLTFIETTGAPALCGPVGDCNAVQQSEFARLFGTIPVGAAGVAGYGAILIVWIVAHLLPGTSGERAALLLPALALIGTLFSIYLTFLEPFVIGATCLWCLTSAVIMTGLLWLSMPYRQRSTSRGHARR